MFVVIEPLLAILTPPIRQPPQRWPHWHSPCSSIARAWEPGLKSITVFRYGSKGQQVLELGAAGSVEEREHSAKGNPHACKLW